MSCTSAVCEAEKPRWGPSSPQRCRGEAGAGGLAVRTAAARVLTKVKPLRGWKSLTKHLARAFIEVLNRFWQQQPLLQVQGEEFLRYGLFSSLGRCLFGRSWGLPWVQPGLCVTPPSLGTGLLLCVSPQAAPGGVGTEVTRQPASPHCCSLPPAGGMSCCVLGELCP